MSFYTYEYSALMDASGMAQLAVTAIDPLSAQVSLVVTGSLGSMQLDLNGQLAQAMTLEVFLSTPFAAWAALLDAYAKFAAIVVGPPLTFSADYAAQLALIASLKAEIGALEALMKATLDLNDIALGFVGAIAAQLSAGPVKVVGWEGPGTDSATVASQLSSALSTFTGDTYGVMLVTQSPAAWNGIKFMLKATG